VKEAEANEQYKSIRCFSMIGALRAASPKWEFEQINFVMGNRRSVVECDFYTKFKKLDVQEGKKDKLFTDHVTQVCEDMRSARSGYFVLLSASARICEANHKGIEGEHWTQCAVITRAHCARVMRYIEEHTLTERQRWGRRMMLDLG